MAKQYDIRQVEYAYEINTAVIYNMDVPAVPEILIEGQPAIPAVPASFKSRITITYELRLANKDMIGIKEVEHYIPHATRLNTSQKAQLFKDNFKPFVQADKLELSGFMEV